MSKFGVVTLTALLGVALCIGCTDRLSGPEAVQLVDAVDQSLSRDAYPGGRWFGGIYERDSRLRAASTAVLQRDGQELAYRAVVFERVIAPSSGSQIRGCAGTRWAA